MSKVELEGTELGPDTDSDTKCAVEKWYEIRGGAGAMEDMAERSGPFAIGSDIWHGRGEHIIVVDLVTTPGWRSEPVGATLRKKQAEKVVDWFGSLVDDIHHVDPSEIQALLNEILSDEV